MRDAASRGRNHPPPMKHLIPLLLVAFVAVFVTTAPVQACGGSCEKPKSGESKDGSKDKES